MAGCWAATSQPAVSGWGKSPQGRRAHRRLSLPRKKSSAEQRSTLASTTWPTWADARHDSASEVMRIPLVSRVCVCSCLSMARERLRFPLQLSQEMIDNLFKPFLVREIHVLETDDAVVVDDVDRRPGRNTPSCNDWAFVLTPIPRTNAKSCLPSRHQEAQATGLCACDSSWSSSPSKPTRANA